MSILLSYTRRRSEIDVQNCVSNDLMRTYMLCVRSPNGLAKWSTNGLYSSMSLLDVLK